MEALPAEQRARNEDKECNILLMPPVADPGGPVGPPPIPIFFKIMHFSGCFKGKTPILSKFWAQGPPLGSKRHWGPLTKILDPRLASQYQ